MGHLALVKSERIRTVLRTSLAVKVRVVQVLDQVGDHVDGTVHLEVTADKEPSVGVDHFDRVLLWSVVRVV